MRVLLFLATVSFIFSGVFAGGFDGSYYYLDGSELGGFSFNSTTKEYTKNSSATLLSRYADSKTQSPQPCITTIGIVNYPETYREGEYNYFNQFFDQAKRIYDEQVAMDSPKTVFKTVGDTGYIFQKVGWATPSDGPKEVLSYSGVGVMQVHNETQAVLVYVTSSTKIPSFHECAYSFESDTASINAILNDFYEKAPLHKKEVVETAKPESKKNETVIAKNAETESSALPEQLIGIRATAQTKVPENTYLSNSAETALRMQNLQDKIGWSVPQFDSKSVDEQAWSVLSVAKDELISAFSYLNVFKEAREEVLQSAVETAGKDLSNADSVFNMDNPMIKEVISTIKDKLGSAGSDEDSIISLDNLAVASNYLLSLYTSTKSGEWAKESYEKANAVSDKLSEVSDKINTAVSIYEDLTRIDNQFVGGARTTATALVVAGHVGSEIGEKMTESGVPGIVAIGEGVKFYSELATAPLDAIIDVDSKIKERIADVDELVSRNTFTYTALGKYINPDTGYGSFKYSENGEEKTFNLGPGVVFIRINDEYVVPARYDTAEPIGDFAFREVNLPWYSNVFNHDKFVMVKRSDVNTVLGEFEI